VRERLCVPVEALGLFGLTRSREAAKKVARGGRCPVGRAADGSPRVVLFCSSGFPARDLPCGGTGGAGWLTRSREAAKGSRKGGVSGGASRGRGSAGVIAVGVWPAAFLP